VQLTGVVGERSDAERASQAAIEATVSAYEARITKAAAPTGAGANGVVPVAVVSAPKQFNPVYSLARAGGGALLNPSVEFSRHACVDDVTRRRNSSGSLCSACRGVSEGRVVMSSTRSHYSDHHAGCGTRSMLRTLD
jgi:hypothetical protein